MGEIGFPRSEFLHDIRWWEAASIIRGHNRRQRHLWSATRWQTYRLMEVQIGSDGMRKNGFNNPEDLIRFPWDAASSPPITQEEASELQAEMDALNAQADSP